MPGVATDERLEFVIRQGAESEDGQAWPVAMVNDDPLFPRELIRLTIGMQPKIGSVELYSLRLLPDRS